MEQKELLTRVQSELKAKKPADLSMIIGLDGFVDEIIHVVDQRQDFNTFSRVQTIGALGERIQRAAGLSANIEFVVAQTKLGGNGPILSNALIEAGVKLTYVGALGKPIHPVFQPMAGKSEKVYSLCDPGHTDALEFTDGKLMLGKITVLNELTWDNFKGALGTPAEIAAMIQEVNLFGMENWTMNPGMSAIWEGMVNEVFPLLGQKPDDKKTIAFFDLADPEKRTKDDILLAMALISKFERKFQTILGLNEKELYEIAEVFGVTPAESLPADKRLEQAARAVYDKLAIHCLVVHPTKEAVCCIGDRFSRVAGPYCPNPVLTTGAGDNFNAGFCLGQALGLTGEEALAVGVATSGYYVRNARSPKFGELQEFLGEWSEGKV